MTKRRETREYPIEVIASISSGVLLCEFGQMHEAAEFLMGHRIWMQHFANTDLESDMQRTILQQCPGMPTELPGVTAENYRECIARLRAEFGEKVTIRKGDGLTAMLPTDGIPDHLQGRTIFVDPKAPKR